MRCLLWLFCCKSFQRCFSQCVGLIHITMSSDDILRAEISHLSKQSEILHESLSVFNLKSSIPSISQYFPQSASEIEIQEFNTACKIPSRLATSEDDIALWILESEELNRSKTAAYLTNPSDSAARVVLEKIAIKICSLEVASGFVDGLKFFLPVVGCFDINVGTQSEVALNISTQEMTVLKYVLKIYIQAHLYYSKNPLFETANGMENLAILIELGLSVLDVCKVLQLKKKSQTIAMSDFFAVVRNLMRKGVNLALSIKKMTDLFVSSSTGRGLTALKLPTHLPSYLFSQVRKEGYLSMTCQLDSPLRLFYARLTHNALYLFDPSVDISLSAYSNNSASAAAAAHSSPYKLVSCSPLETVHIQLMDRTEQCGAIGAGGSGGDGEGLLELMSINEFKLPLIEYNHKEHYISSGGGGVQEWLGPRSITNHDSIYLSIDSFKLPSGSDVISATPEDTPMPDGGGVNSEVSAWMDALENSCWESRVAKKNQR